MNKETKLKPCPFCGGKPECGVEFYKSSGSNITLKAEVWCERCCIGRAQIFKATEITLVPFERYTDAFNKAISEWNKRAKDE